MLYKQRLSSQGRGAQSECRILRAYLIDWRRWIPFQPSLTLVPKPPSKISRCNCLIPHDLLNSEDRPNVVVPDENDENATRTGRFRQLGGSCLEIVKLCPERWKVILEVRLTALLSSSLGKFTQFLKDSEWCPRIDREVAIRRRRKRLCWQTSQAELDFKVLDGTTPASLILDVEEEGSNNA
ncbi:hypothetical protein M0802_002659 [Mischocyttarus mexicanus]|nr:hypothetical protein M0802_002659 [Mischocyttarus mexicanus]